MVGTVSAQLAVVHRRGMNCACGISSVFAIFGSCPCITACMISTVFGIFLMVSIRFCIAGSSPLNCTYVVSTAFWIFRVARHLAVTLSVAQLECSPLCRIAGEPESEASLLFAVGLGLPELVRLSTVSSTSFSMNWTCGICAVF